MTACRIGEEREEVDRWLARMGEQAGFHLQLDSEGVCAIGHSSGVDGAIELAEARREVFLRVPLMPWPPARPEVLAAQCLQAHFLGIDTGGGSFAIDPAGPELVLWMSRPLDGLGAQAFATWVVQFLEAAGRWREVLLALDTQAGGAAEAREFDAPIPAAPLRAA